MFPFDRPKDYNEMLNKIGIFTFMFAFGLTWLVSQSVPTIARFLDSRSAEVEVLSLHVRVLYVVPAVLVSLIARVIRLHNCISTMFGIRKSFDLYRILIPLCGSVGISVDIAFRNKLAGQRAKFMEKTFYTYASFEDPKISKSLVLSAIDLWTWYWILLELIALLVIVDGVFLVARAYLAASLASVGLLVATLVFLTCYQRCGRKADAQIEQIVSDAQRAQAIKTDLAAL